MGVLRKFIDALALVLALIVAPVVIIAARLFGNRDASKLDWSGDQFADCLRTRCSENPSWGEWDLFSCCEMLNPDLETLRQRALDVEDAGSTQVPPVYLDEDAARELERLARQAERLSRQATRATVVGDEE